ncbi:MAG: hypothetical protein NC110_00735 [Ruminococcus sp.]|nr:hypothetical protein [Ruminococcus sp.]
MKLLGNSTFISRDNQHYIVFDNGIELPFDFVAVREKKTGEIWGFLPRIRMAEDSDYRWQLSCLKDRLENPKKYEDNLNKNVNEVIECLAKWVSDYENSHPDIKARRAAGHYKGIEPSAELLEKYIPLKAKTCA